MSLLDAIPATIEAEGAAEAAGVRQKGQIYGSLISNLADVPAQVVQQQADRRQQQQTQQLRDLQIQQQQNDLQRQASDLQGQQVIDNLMKTGVMQTDENGVTTYNRAMLTKGMADAGYGHLVPAYMKQLDASDEAALAKNQAQAKLDETTRNLVGAQGAAVYESGDSVPALNTALTYLVAHGAKTHDEANALLQSATAAPTTIPGLRSGWMAASPQYKDYLSQDEARKASAQQRQAAAAKATSDAAKADADEAAKQDATQTQNAATQLSGAQTQADYRQKWQGLPTAIQQKFDPPEVFDPKQSPQRARFVAMTPEQQQNALNQLTTQEREKLLAQAQSARDYAEAAKAKQDAGEKPVTAAQKAEAERWKQGELDKLEKAYSASQPDIDPVTGVATPKVANGANVTPLTADDLDKAKARIQTSYLTQIGLPPPTRPAVGVAAPAAVAPPAPAAGAPKKTPAVGDPVTYKGKRYTVTGITNGQAQIEPLPGQ